MAADRLDLVVMGATGFTGKHVVRTVMDLARERGGFSWGVAGRNEQKLRKLMETLTATTGQDVTKVPVLIADIEDEVSLKEMTKRARVVLNCCGPYRFYGEKVIKACIQTKTHHVDVAGEPQYMEEMQLHYNDAAAEQGVYIISACGLSGVPADVGVVHFSKLFDGIVNDLDFFISFEYTGTKNIGTPVHYATWESAVHGLANLDDLMAARKKLFSIPFPKLKPALKKRGLLHKSPEIDGWCLRFSGADRSVVRRSQHFLYKHEGRRPVQCDAYVSVGNLFFTLFVMLFVGVVGCIAIYGNKFMRKLLLKYPGPFSLGTVSHKGPSEEEMNNVVFHMTFHGRGWSEKNIEKDHSAPPNKEMTMRLTAKNPGYGLTCNALVLAAMTILTEKAAMPGRGGVISPGAAFANTTFVEQLQAHGVDIQVLSKKQI
ncbi:hypothetical protein LSTR_LSTR004324 [Laodelphax striatellus]|uniref:Saccharopine dehydrogenase NADP binding domain-containing protein n=1 Tax=Laodelphax striatellus TaxID=195883 RepID=A0A482X8A3_LAOST|nr:hypothetical protein LSTR_LSTR004324 [Laodelphax striatellus]